MLSQKLTRLQTIAQKANLDGIALIPGTNLYYLTGVPFHLTERAFIVFIPTKGDPATVIPRLEAQQLIDTGLPGEFFLWDDASGDTSAFQQAVTALNLAGKRIGVEGLNMRVKDSLNIQKYAQGVQIVDADDALIEFRIIKSPEEIENHRHAIRISEQALSTLLERLEVGMSERQIAQMLSNLQKEFGGSADAFGPTVLIGERSAYPHGITGDKTLQNGDTLCIDFGTIYKGYMSDITRTFFVGAATERQRQVYETVLAANEAGRQKAAPGISCQEVDRTTAQVMRDAGFSEYIKHRTGHGLGIAIHEHPNITVGNTQILEPGMVFTVEPGLYIEGEFGVRIEDNVVVTENGLETLTTFPREITILEL